MSRLAEGISESIPVFLVTTFSFVTGHIDIKAIDATVSYVKDSLVIISLILAIIVSITKITRRKEK